jgi:hypothetical protein
VSRFIPDHGKARFAEMDKLAIFQWLQHVHFPYGRFHFALTMVSLSHHRNSRRPLHQQSCRDLPHPQTDMNLYRDRIPSTVPFARQAPGLTRHYVPLRSMLKCEGNMAFWCSVVLRKERGNHIVSLRSPFACAGPDLGSGIPGATYRHVTGPQVVPQCSLQEQPSLHAIRIFHGFYPARERAAQRLQTYLSLKESCSYTPQSDFPMNKPLQKIYLPLSLPRIHVAGEVNPGQEKTKRCTYGDTYKQDKKLLAKPLMRKEDLYERAADND